ncbi:MAG: GTPase HflX [Rhodothermales bacterium]
MLVGVRRPEPDGLSADESLAELALLADTAGAVVTDRVIQSLPQLQAATYIGRGKVGELKGLVSMRAADLVIFDDDLSPVQLRNLEKELGCKLVDRSGLILDIFAQRAKTSAAKAQVELAQLEYLRTRLTRQWTHLSRQKGGIGTKGPGETQIETDRRLIRDRIAVLKDKLEKIDRQRTTQRKGRSLHTRVSLVGYTNAGKSTLMNSLAGAEVHAEDRLFATLDATTRLVYLARNKQVLLSDTVGFIRKLPHRLIESFKSTLDEVRESDLLLHVVDVTHPARDEQIRVVNETLEEIGALDKPTLMVFNKVDALASPDELAGLRASLPTESVFVSASRAIGLDHLKERIIEVMEANFVETEVILPAAEGRILTHIHSVAEVISQEYVFATGADGGEPIPAVRLHFRTAPQHYEDLKIQLNQLSRLTV